MTLTFARRRPPTSAVASMRDGRASRAVRTPRGAFTLIELLVVISIIAILLGLTIGVTLSFVTSAREAATRATLAKIEGQVQNRMGALRRGLETRGGAFSGAGIGTVGPLKLKMEMMSAMPGYLYPQAGQSPLSEADDVTRRVRSGSLAPQAPFDDADFSTDPTASSEALLLFLTRGESYGVENAALESFTESELADTDGDGLREIVDGFGNPIRFYRWPTRLIRPAPDTNGDGVISRTEAQADNGDGRFGMAAYSPGSGQGENSAATAALFESSLPSQEFDGSGAEIAADSGGDPFLPTLGSALRSDPDDRYAQLPLEFVPMFRRVLSNTSDLNVVGKEFELLFHTPSTFYMPIAVSAGPDGELGLYEPQDRANFGHLAQPSEPYAALDNLTTAQTGF